MKTTHYFLWSSAIAVGSSAAQLTSPFQLSFSDLGADAALIASPEGQNFADIGSVTGLGIYDGVSLNLRYVADGSGVQFVQVNGLNSTGAVATQPEGEAFNFSNGTVFGMWSVPLEFETRLGEGIADNEFLTFGNASEGSLISNHSELGLTVGDDAISNTSGETIISGESPLWYTAASSSFTVSHDGVANASGFSINLSVPEPSSAVLLLIAAIGGISHRKRN